MITLNRKGPKLPKPAPMREIDAMRALMFERFKRNLVVNRYTPRGWWECDVFEMTQAGYYREYEIKISRADFFKDAEKEMSDHHAPWQPDANGIMRIAKVKKHDLLRRGDPRGPSQFWYVVPEGMIEEKEVPEFAGLIYMKHWTDTHKPWRFKESLIRRAPQLHRIKPQEALRAHAEGVCYWRWHGLMTEGKCLCDISTADGESLPPQ